MGNGRRVDSRFRRNDGGAQPARLRECLFLKQSANDLINQECRRQRQGDLHPDGPMSLGRFVIFRKIENLKKFGRLRGVPRGSRNRGDDATRLQGVKLQSGCVLNETFATAGGQWAVAKFSPHHLLEDFVGLTARKTRTAMDGLGGVVLFEWIDRHHFFPKERMRYFARIRFPPFI